MNTQETDSAGNSDSANWEGSYLDSQPVGYEVVVRGEASRDPKYRHSGALVIKNGETMVVTSYVADQFPPRLDSPGALGVEQTL